MKVWIQCRTAAEAEFFVQAVIGGYFGGPLFCQISPLNPCSADVNLHSYQLEDEKIRKIPFLVDWDYYEKEEESFADQVKLVEANRWQPPDLRRGVLLPMRDRKTAH